MIKISIAIATLLLTTVLNAQTETHLYAAITQSRKAWSDRYKDWITVYTKNTNLLIGMYRNTLEIVGNEGDKSLTFHLNEKAEESYNKGYNIYTWEATDETQEKCTVILQKRDGDKIAVVSIYYVNLFFGYSYVIKEF